MDAKCECQKCGGNILFDCSGLKQDEARAVECPHCHQQTLVYVPRVPLEQMSPPPPPPLAGLKINKSPKVSASGQSSLYYYQSVDGEAGPYTLGQMRSMWDNGQINGDALCRSADSQEWQSLSTIIEANQKPVPRPAAPRTSLNYANYLMIVVLALSVLAFFLPNISVSIPILGKIEVSMFDFLTPNGHDSKNGSDLSAKPSFSFKDLKGNDLFQLKKASVGALLCLVSGSGLLGHYLFSVLWAVLNFAFRKSFRIFNWLWLGLAIQFPILFTIGTHLALSALKTQMLAEASKNNGGAAGDAAAANMGAAFASNISVGPAAMMWVLFGIALAAFLLPPMLRRNA